MFQITFFKQKWQVSNYKQIEYESNSACSKMTIQTLGYALKLRVGKVSETCFYCPRWEGQFQKLKKKYWKAKARLRLEGTISAIGCLCKQVKLYSINNQFKKTKYIR